MSIKLKKMTFAGCVAVMACAEGVFAFATGNATGGEKGDCLYTKQLQTSVAMRRLYLVKLDQVQGKGGELYAKGDSCDDADDGTLSAGWHGADSKAPVAVDALSADCLGCHDGVNASSVTVDLRNRPHDRSSRVASRETDHPIGMDYNSYVSANRGYNRIAPSSNKMVFVNGKVGCLTCHDPLNTEKGHLVMSDRESALCKTCHNK